MAQQTPSDSSINTNTSPTIIPTTPTGAIAIHNSVTHKLTRDNFRLWKSTVVPILKGHSLYGFIDGTLPCPSSTITTQTATGAVIVPNPDHKLWQMQDQLILGAINSALTESILSHVVKCTTAREAWTTLEKLFSSQSQARTMHVYFQLATLKKGNTSIADYFQKFSALTDTLAAVNHPLNDFETVSFLLAGLGTDYDSFVTSITTRVEPLSIDEIYGHLLAHEQRILHQISSLNISLD